jgi:hypothetical protein
MVVVFDEDLVEEEMVACLDDMVVEVDDSVEEKSTYSAAAIPSPSVRCLNKTNWELQQLDLGS